MKKTDRLLYATLVTVLSSVLLACSPDTGYDTKRSSKLIVADVNLLNCIEQTKIDATAIEDLDCKDNTIVSLSGIESLSRLKTLNLASNQVAELQPLLNLLQRQQNENTEGSGFSNPLLTEIDLSNNQITNASKLQEYTRFTRVILDGNPLAQLTAPEALFIASSDGRLILRWQGIPGALGYRIYGSRLSSLTDEVVLASAINSTRFVYETENEIPVYFRISALYPQGEGEKSSIFSATPAIAKAIPVASKILFIHAKDNSIYIDWHEQDDASYQTILYQKTAQKETNQYQRVEAISPPYTLSGLEPDTQYTVAIVAGNAMGNVTSEPINVRTTTPVSGKPIVRKFNGLAQNQEITLNWAFSAAYVQVNLHYAINQPATEQSPSLTAKVDEDLIHRGLTPETQYHYLLIATDQAGNTLKQTLTLRTRLTIAEIDFDDDTLSQCVKNSGYLYAEEVKRLVCNNSDISKLTGIDTFKNLVYLDLSNNRIEALTALSDLQHLLDVNLQGNLLTDVTLLAGLTQLQALQLQNNAINTIEFVAGLANLTGLGLSNNPIESIKPLSTLLKLEKLQLAHIYLNDLSELTQLPQLTHLTLANNRLTDITRLSQFAGLQYVDLAGNQISDFSVIQTLGNLVYVNQLGNRPPTLVAKNTIPVAYAGDDIDVTLFQSTTLDGRLSHDADEDPLKFQWELLSAPLNSEARLFNAHLAQPEFTADISGDYLFQLIVNDGISDSEADTVLLNYKANQRPEAIAGENRIIKQSALVTLDGRASNDPEGSALSYQWQLTHAPIGNSAVLINASTAQAGFTPVQRGEYTFSLIVNDGQQDSAVDTVVLHYLPNRVPVASAGNDIQQENNTLVTLRGGNSSDPDGDALSFQWTIVSAPTGSVALLNNATSENSSFLPDLKGTYSVRLVVNDGTVNSIEDTVNVNFVYNRTPVANASDDITQENNTLVTLRGGNSADPDGDALSFQWSIVSAPAGSVASLNNATSENASFLPDRKGNYILRLIVNDGTVNSIEDTVNVNFVYNRTPVANAGSDITQENNALVTLRGGNSSDPDGDSLNFQWTIVSAPTGSVASLNNATSENTSFLPDRKGNYILRLIVNDGTVNSIEDTVNVNFVYNRTPVANAGDDITQENNALVTLRGGNSSDADGDPLSFQWTIVSAPTGSLTALINPNAENSSFFPDLRGNYVVRLVVNDGTVNSIEDTVNVNFVYNRTPVANAGNDIQQENNTLVTLRGGNSSDPDGDPLSFQWNIASAPAGSVAVLNNATSENASFLPDRKGDYILRLIVNDGTVNSIEDTVNVNFIYNRTPVASAGNDIQQENNTLVTLRGGNSSDPDGDPLSFQWSIASAPAGSVASLNNATSENASFLPDRKGNYILRLIVNDGTVDSIEDTVNVNFVYNRTPVANAGNDIQQENNTLVTLRGGNSSDPDGDPLSFQWSIVSAPAGSVASLNNATSENTSFLPDRKGNYILRLIVNDGAVNSIEDTVNVNFVYNRTPVANAGDDITQENNALVTLRGGNSADPDGDALSFQWSIVSAPTGSVAVLNNATSESSSFLPDLKGNYVVRLVVNDGTVNSIEDTVNVNFVYNRTPVANAGVDITKTVAESVTLDGRNSTDLDGDELTYQWQLINGPVANVAVLINATTAQPGFTPIERGEYIFSLIVSDGLLASEADTVSLNYIPNRAPIASFAIILDENGGASMVGDVLNASYVYSDLEGDLEGNSTYQWLRNGVAISGATTSSYRLVTADAGTEISFEVIPVALTNMILGSATVSDSNFVLSEIFPLSAKIAFPPKKSLTEGDSIIVRGSASGIREISSVTVNGVVATSDDGFETWIATVPALTTGLNLLSATVTDTQNNVVTESVEIRRGPLADEISKLTLDFANDRFLALENNQLIEINKSTGNTSRIDSVDTINALRSVADMQLDSANNRMIVIDNQNNVSTIKEVNLTTGARTIFSQDSIAAPEGSFRLAYDLALDAANNRMFITDGADIIEMDMTTRARTLFSSVHQSYKILWDAENKRIIAMRDNALIAIDDITGAQTTLSNNNMAIETSNISFSSLRSIALDITNNWIYVASYNGSIIKVDLADGTRTLVSDNTFPGNLDIINPNFMEYDSANNRLIVSVTKLISVDVETGERTEINNVYGRALEGIGFDSGNQLLYAVSNLDSNLLEFDLDNAGVSRILSDNMMATVTSNTSFSSIKALELNLAAGLAYISDWDAYSVIQVDLVTGTRTILADNSIPDTNNTFISPEAFAWDAVGNRMLVLDSDRNSLIEVDYISGTRRVISSPRIPDGENPFLRPKDIVLDATNNRAFVLDSNNTRSIILSVDLMSGARTLVGSFDDSPFSFNDTFDLDVSNNRFLMTSWWNGLIEMDFEGVTNTLSGRELHEIVFDPISSHAFALESDSFNRDALEIVDIDLITHETEIVSTGVTPDNIISLDKPFDIVVDSENNRGFVSDEGHMAIIVLDLDTGARTVLADNSLASELSNIDFMAPKGIVLDSVRNRLLVIDGGQRALISVALDTGARTLISNNAIATTVSTLSFSRPSYISLDEFRNRALIVDGGRSTIVAVDLSTGARTRLSDSFSVSNGVITIDVAGNRALVSDLDLNIIVTIDLDSGLHSIFVDRTTPVIGIDNFFKPSGITLDIVNNRLIFVDFVNRNVQSADLFDGTRTVLAPASGPNDFFFNSTRGVAYDLTHNRALVIENNRDSVIAVDLVTGARVMFSQ